MTVPRLFAVLFIFATTAVAWFALGGTIVGRTGEYDGRLSAEVAQLWGGPHVQVAPKAAVERPRTVTEQVTLKSESGAERLEKVTKTVIDSADVPLDSSRVRTALTLDHRRKGLLWYATYGVDFHAEYRYHNPDEVARQTEVRFQFPASEAIYDGLSLRVNGVDAPRVSDLSKGLTIPVQLPAKGEARIEIAYRSRGLGSWTYAFVDSGVAQVKDFDLELTTDFDRIDFPAGTISPNSKTREGRGWRLHWQFASLAGGQRIGLTAPNRLNPGPLASRITFFAPVSLLFFFTVMVILGIMRARNLHPMNYFFLAAAFFAFHLLLAYLVDHLDIHAAFLIAAATSLFLVTSYLRIVAGMRVALIEAGLAQLVFLVLFSYAFFFEGYTGVTVTIGAVLTLFVLMQVTARVRWEEVFASRRAPANGSVLGRS
jgi:inner membrane protein involved in colicin E2 resistance